MVRVLCMLLAAFSLSACRAVKLRPIPTHRPARKRRPLNPSNPQQQSPVRRNPL